MKEFKWHLFHLQFWFLLLSIFYSILTTPIHFFPAQVRCSIGFLRERGVGPLFQVIVVHFVYAGIVSAVVLLFENRHRHLAPTTDFSYRIHKSPRILLGILNFSVGITNTIPVVLQEETQEFLKLKYLAVLPCPMDLYFDVCSFAQSKRITGWSLLAYSTNVLVTVEIAFFITHCFFCLRKSQLVDTFSVRTKRLQVAFFKAAIAQVAAPLVVLFLPFIMLFYLLAMSANLQGLINICVLFIPANSAFSTISLLYFNAAYRKFIKGLIQVPALMEISNNRVAVASSV
ncbi:hypothetical protein GCK72_002737 [Caenorhabditis remanei]|uniref:Uncharacterized protein n=1 Tax=Caenorhabditis remanei TaxID=31234 RepID=A0A6A5HWX8_CAERE|nr:hypothetical protein GCK72_002737 [Caenorhabditis remanei]KAF1770913.1 hypothetical protein GCK72_002737 [Caenorhabditis remanei]